MSTNPNNAGSGAVPTVTAVGEQVNGVAPNRKQEVQFSESMDPATINGQTFTITDSSGKPVTGSVTYMADYNVAAFQPNPALQSNASYTATVTAGAASAGGMHLATAYTYSFTTRAATDTSPLAVTQVSPAANSSCVSASTTITITFSETPDASQVNANNIVVKGPDGSVLATKISTNVSTTQIVVTPVSPLPSGTITVTVQNIGDLADAVMTAPYTWSFSTACTGGGGGGGANGAEYLYSSAVSQGGSIYGFKIDMNTGNLAMIPGSPFSEDAGPPMGCAQCLLQLLADPLGRFIYYNFGVGSMQVNASTGALTEIGNSHPGTFNLRADPTGRFIYSSPGGNGVSGNNSNSINGWAVSSSGNLSNVPGWPYIFQGDVTYGEPAVSQNFVFATSFNPTGNSTIFGFKIDQSTGALTQVSSTSEGAGGSLSVMTPSGAYLYSEVDYNNNGVYDTEIVGYKVNADGTLTPINMAPQQLPDPAVTNLIISPNGNFMYAMGSAIRVFKIDPNSGALSLVTTDTTTHVGGYVWFDPTNKYAYANTATGPQNNIATNNIQGYLVDQNTGALKAIPTAVVTLPNAPQSVAIVRPQ